LNVVVSLSDAPTAKSTRRPPRAGGRASACPRSQHPERQTMILRHGPLRARRRSHAPRSRAPRASHVLLRARGRHAPIPRGHRRFARSIASDARMTPCDRRDASAAGTTPDRTTALRRLSPKVTGIFEMHRPRPPRQREAQRAPQMMPHHPGRRDHRRVLRHRTEHAEDIHVLCVRLLRRAFASVNDVACPSPPPYGTESANVHRQPVSKFVDRARPFLRTRELATHRARAIGHEGRPSSCFVTMRRTPDGSRPPRRTRGAARERPYTVFAPSRAGTGEDVDDPILLR